MLSREQKGQERVVFLALKLDTETKDFHFECKSTMSVPTS